MKWANQGQKYDVIVISQALHQLKRSAALEVLRRAKAALKSGGRLFLLAKLTRDQHVRRVAGSPEWERVRGEKNTWRRLEMGKVHPTRPRPGPLPAQGGKAELDVAPEGATRQLRRGRESGPEFHAGRPRRRWMLLSALTAGEIQRALRGLRLVCYREVVLRSDWEENAVVTHRVAEVVAERR